MRVLIIDDEKPVRQAIRALGHWDELGVGGFFEAVEGEDGLRILREHRPDIVLVDMKMPVMDGARFLEIAGREHPEAKYIVISGYDDFEYARRALRAKVMDYLLKPVIESELNGVLARAIRDIAVERRKEAELAAHAISKPLARESLVKMLMNGEMTEPLSPELRALLNCGGPETYYSVAILRIVNFEEIIRSHADFNYHTMISGVLAVLDHLCASWNRGFSFHDFEVRNEITLFFACDIPAGETARDRIAFELRNIIQEMQDVQGLYIIAGLGPPVGSPELLSQSYRAASTILYNANILASKESVFTECDAEGGCHLPSLLDKKEMLIYAMESGNLGQTRRIIADYFRNIESTGFLSLESLRKTAREFFVLLETIIRQFDVFGGERVLNETLNETAVRSYARLDEFRDAVSRAVEELFNQIQKERGDKEKRYLSEIKDYIERNYHRDIKLGFFSERYYLSKEYLSKLFREDFGYTIYEYVLKVRMEKARELLADPDVKVLAVSQHLGYQDTNYFSRAFKTYYGVSPTEYRENILGQR